MSKTPFEIRTDILQLVSDRQNQAYQAKINEWATAYNVNHDAKLLTEVPEYPSTEELLVEAEKLKKFVDGG